MDLRQERLPEEAGGGSGRIEYLTEQDLRICGCIKKEREGYGYYGRDVLPARPGQGDAAHGRPPARLPGRRRARSGWNWCRASRSCS